MTPTKEPKPMDEDLKSNAELMAKAILEGNHEAAIPLADWIFEFLKTGKKKFLSLWLLSQTQNSGWDTYDSCVVCAPSSTSAKKITPNGKDQWDFSDWASSPDQVQCEYIGLAKEGMEERVILASFNAG